MSEMMYSNMIVAGVVCRDVSAYQVVGSHRLVFELEFDLRKWGKSHAAYVTTLRLAVKIDSVMLGIAWTEEEDFLPPAEPEFLNSEKVRRRFAVSMDHQTLDEIERKRKAADLSFEIEVLGTGELCRLQDETLPETTPVGNFVRAEPLAFGKRLVKATLYHQMPQSVWVKLLDQMGYARTLLFEIPWSKDPGDSLAEAISHFEDARRLFLSGYYAEAVARLRDCLDSACSVIDCEKFSWKKVSEKLSEKASREDMKAQERFLLVWNSVRHLTNFAHHEGDYSREEAHYILGMGALALSLASTAPGVLRKAEEEAP